MEEQVVMISYFLSFKVSNEFSKMKPSEFFASPNNQKQKL